MLNFQVLKYKKSFCYALYAYAFTIISYLSWLAFRFVVLVKFILVSSKLKKGRISLETNLF